MRSKSRSRRADLRERGALLAGLLLILTCCNPPQTSQASPSPSAGSPQSGSAVNLPPPLATAWEQMPGGFQLSHTFPTHPYPLLVSPPVADASTGDVFVLAIDTTFRPALGRWHEGQWAFSSPPARFSAMAYDPARQQVIAVAAAEGVVGPSSSFETVGSDSWGWDGSTWQKLSLGVAVAFGMFPGDTLFYDPRTQSLELVSLGATDSGYQAYARSKLGPQGNWQIIECGTGFWPDATTVEPCGLPTKVGVPTPFPWLFSSSPDASPPALLGPGGILGYDPRLQAVIGYQQLNNGTGRLLGFSNGSWQPISSAAPNIPFGFWSGAYDSFDETLWIAGHTPDGAFHLYRDDVADGFRIVTLTHSPTEGSAITTGAGAEADKLTRLIVSGAWSQSLAYDPLSQRLLWLDYADPTWSSGPFRDCCIGATVMLQVSTWTFSTSGFKTAPPSLLGSKPRAVCIDYLDEIIGSPLDSRPAADYCYSATSSHGFDSRVLRNSSATDALTAMQGASVILFAGHAQGCKDDTALPWGFTAQGLLLVNPPGGIGSSSYCHEEWDARIKYAGDFTTPAILGKAKLVILLACLTALETRGYPSSLADSAFAAGAKTVVAFSQEIPFSPEGAVRWSKYFWYYFGTRGMTVQDAVEEASAVTVYTYPGLESQLSAGQIRILGNQSLTIMDAAK